MNTRRSVTSVANVGQRRPQPQSQQQPQPLADNFVSAGQMKPQQQPVIKMPVNQQQTPPGPQKLLQIANKQKGVAVASTPPRPNPAATLAKPFIKEETLSPAKQQPIRTTQDTPQLHKLTPQLLKQSTNKTTVPPPISLSKPCVIPTIVTQLPATAVASAAAVAEPQPKIESVLETETPMEVGGDLIKLEEAMHVEGEGLKKRPKWLTNKSRLDVFRSSKADKVRRKNAHFRKILQPKNALMILNELNGSTPYNFVELGMQDSALKSIKHAGGFKAVTVVEGVEYSGIGVDKVTAKSNAAESAIKSIILKKILSASTYSRQQGTISVPNSSTDTQTADPNPNPVADNNGDTDMPEGELMAAVAAADSMSIDSNEAVMVPWMHIASFALHKLFNSWEETGTLLRASTQGNLFDIAGSPGPFAGHCAPNSQPPSSALTAAQLPQRALPENALAMHPVMLLNQMRPGTTQYLEQPVIGTPPHILYSYECTVDGKGSFPGKGPNKKIARRNAAYVACKEVLNLQYPPEVQQDIADSSQPRKPIAAAARAPRPSGSGKQVNQGVGGYFVRQSQLPQQVAIIEDGGEGFTANVDPGYQWY